MTDGANWLGTPTLPWNGTNGPSNVAVFNTAASPTVTVGETVTTNGITFTQGATLSGGTISLAGSTPTLTVVGSSTISSVIGGSSLTKNGTGLLTLSGTNTYTGGTILNAGTLSVSANVNLGAAGTSITVGGNSSLLVNANGVTYDRAIALSSGTLTIAGNAGANTFSGQVTGGGSLVVNPAVANGHNFTNTNNTFSGQLAIGTASTTVTVRFNSLGDSATNAIVLGALNGAAAAGTFLYQGTPQLTLNRPIQLQGGGNTTGSNRNSLYNTGGGLVLNGNMSVSSGAAARAVVLTNDSATNASTFAGNISNGTATLGVEKAGVGTWILSGANTYTGTTTITGGWLQLGSAENAGTSGPMGKPATLANSVVLSGGGLRFTAVNTYDYTTSGRLQLADAATGSIDTNGQNVTFANAIGVGAAKTGRLTKTGAGTLTLQGVNTYTGTTSVSGGTLTIDAGAGGALSSSSPLTLSGTGVFNYDNSTATGAKSQTLAAFNFSGGDATVTITRTAAQAVTLSGSSFTRAAGATGNFVYAGTPGTIGTDSSINLTGAAAGFLSPALYYQGSDYASLNGAGTYVRGINYGTDANSESVTASTTALSGTTLYARISGAGQVTGQTTGTITTLNIANANNFTLAGSQTLTLSGILKSGNSAGGRITGGSGIQTGSNAELVIRTDSAADTLEINTPILANGTSSVTKAGAGLLVLSATNTFTGPITINSGTLQVGGSGVLGGGNYTTGTITIASGAALLYTSNQSQTVGTNSNILTGGGDFIMQAPNSLLTSGLNSLTGFSGRFFILSGTIFQVQNGGFATSPIYLGDTSGTSNATIYANAFPRANASSIIVQAGNTGTSTIGNFKNWGAGGDYSLSGAVTLNNTLTVVNLAPASGTNSVSFSGQFTGTGGISLTGNAGLVTLSNSNSYTGPTAVSGGLFQLSNRFAAQNSTLNVTGGSVVFNSGVAAKAFTIGGLTGSGTTTLQDNAATPAGISLTFGGNNETTNYTGLVNVLNGTMSKLGTGTATISRLYLSGTAGTGATLDSSGAGPLVVSGSVTANTGNKTLTLAGSNTGSNSLGAIASSPVSLVKTGVGTWTLTGSSSYVGTTNVDQGTLILAVSAENTGAGTGAFGSNTNAVTVGSATGTGTAALLLNQDVTVGARGITIPAVASGSQVVVLGGANTNGTSTFNNGVNVDLGRDVTLQAATGGTTRFISTWTNGTGRNVTIGSAGNAGTVQLESALSVTGAVSVTSGTLRLAAGGSIADPTSVIVGAVGSTGVVLDVTPQTGTYTFGSAQSLSGIGTIRLDADTLVSVAGFFSPGNSPGIFTFDGANTTTLSGTTFMEITGTTAGTSYDQVRFTNGGSLDYGSGRLLLDLTGTYADNTTFQLFDFAPTASGSFTTISGSGSYGLLSFVRGAGGVWTSGSTSQPSQSLEFRESTGTLVVVPEPATLALAAVGVGLAGWAALRRRK